MRRQIAAALMTCAVMTTSAWGRPSLRSLFDAIREVETGSHEDPARAVGDGGRSIGPYQIQERYWRDSGVAGRYGDVRKSAYAQRTMVAYWTRYCPDALARGDWQTLARVHNGGPEGGRDASTLKYWRKVDEVMRRTGR